MRNRQLFLITGLALLIIFKASALFAGEVSYYIYDRPGRSIISTIDQSGVSRNNYKIEAELFLATGKSKEKLDNILNKSLS